MAFFCGRLPLGFFLLVAGPWLPAQYFFSEAFETFAISGRFLPSLTGPRGYVTLELEIASMASASRLEIELSLNDSSTRQWRTTQRITRRLRLEPASKARVRLRAWCRYLIPSTLTIRVHMGGTRRKHQISLPVPGGYWPNHYQAGPSNVLISTGVGGDFMDWSMAALEKNPDFWAGSLGTTAKTFTRDLFRSASQSVNSWGTHWLDFTPFEMVVLTDKEWRGLPQPKREALNTYLESGGILLLQGNSFEPPEAWRPRESVIEGIGGYSSGFGLVHVSHRGLERSSEAQWAEIWREPFRASQLLETNPMILDLHDRFPLVSDIAIPMRGFFLLMLIFVIIMGPINLGFLAKKNRRIWILVTIPLISIGGTLAVLLFALLTEGTGITFRQEGFTLLDESRKRAVSLGFNGIHSPLTLGRKMRFSPATEILPLLEFSNNHNVSADWTEGQDLSSGWSLSRIPCYYKTRTSEVRRERLSMRPLDSDRLEVTNGLGAPIELLYISDSAGGLFRCRDIAAGGKAIAERFAGQAQPEPENYWRSFFNSDWQLESSPAMAYLNDAGPPILRPNAYVAILAGTPFLEQPLAKVAHFRARSLVYGLRGGTP